ncbi:hypothetical protein Syun_010697 [Stephania yunnanensis]|uniref:Uncharacterized protein n=1 Tax=Stephania yunnanensis TaxID=152371 RepID=A0AAP0KII9_9MAGN
MGLDLALFAFQIGRGNEALFRWSSVDMHVYRSLVDYLSLPATSPPGIPPPCRRSCLPDGVLASSPTSRGAPASLATVLASLAPSRRRLAFHCLLPPSSVAEASEVRRRSLLNFPPRFFTSLYFVEEEKVYFYNITPEKLSRNVQILPN